MDRKKILGLLFLLLMLSVSFPQPLSTEPVSPAEELGEVGAATGLYGMVQGLLIFLIITAATIAAVGYVAAPMLGAEYAARVKVWAGNLLAAVGVAAAILIFFAFSIPFFEGAETGTDIGAQLTNWLESFKDTLQIILVMSIVTTVILSAAAYSIGQIFGAETRAKANVWAQVLLGSAVVATVIYLLISTIFVDMINTSDLSFIIAGKMVPIASYVTVLTTVILIVSFIVLLTFLASRIFKVPEWEAYLNIELTNLVHSFLILLFIVGFFIVSSAVATSITGASSPPLAAIEEVRVLTDSVLTATLDVYIIQSCTSVLGTYHRRIGEAVFTPTFRVFPGIDTFVSITNVLALGFVMVYGSLSAQLAFLNIIDAVMIPFVLPAGLILRFFPPTKEAGAFLIALAFAFQIVFPTAYVINGMALDNIGIQTYTSDKFPISALCGLSYVYFSVPPVLLQGSFPFLASTLQTVFSEGVIHGMSMAIFLPVLKNLSEVSLLAIFAPAVAMILTIASINALTKFIVMKG